MQAIAVDMSAPINPFLPIDRKHVAAETWMRIEEGDVQNMEWG